MAWTDLSRPGSGEYRNGSLVLTLFPARPGPVPSLLEWPPGLSMGYDLNLSLSFSLGAILGL
jgi:hypothetical protein